MKKILVQLVITLAFFQTAFAQEVLTLEEAVQLALKNNYDIRLASNDLKIDEAGVGVANADYQACRELILSLSKQLGNSIYNKGFQ